ncbi:MAG: hypothetical protein Q7R49_00470 [Candidatus Daviesbacteria bacterium]|nr:hypothetical protein [Candidatus Daviesbacteria bacterium]
MITWYKWHCPEDHFQLIDVAEEEGKKNIYCERCSKSYFVSSGVCGDQYITEDFMSALKG